MSARASVQRCERSARERWALAEGCRADSGVRHCRNAASCTASYGRGKRSKGEKDVTLAWAWMGPVGLRYNLALYDVGKIVECDESSQVHLPSHVENNDPKDLIIAVRRHAGPCRDYCIVQPHAHHTPYIIHHTSYTIHHTPYIIHHTSYTIHHTPYIIHHTSYTIHHTPYIIHHTSYTIHHTSYRVTSSGEHHVVKADKTRGDVDGACCQRASFRVRSRAMTENRLCCPRLANLPRDDRLDKIG